MVDGGADGPFTQDWRPDQVAALQALQAWSVGQAELGQHLARWTGLSSSEADALGHVAWAEQSGAPLSPVELSRRVGMTSGATTALVDRLERAGAVVRSRESADRRRVTLRPSERGREQARSFTAFAGAEVAAAVRGASEEELAVVAAFLGRVVGAVAAANARLAARGGPTGPGGTPGG